MKQFFSLVYAVLVVFALLGSLGYLFYYNVTQFAIADIVLLIVLALGYFRVIELPNNKWFE